MGPHNAEQMDLLGHVSFYPIVGYPSLFVSDVSEEDEIMLKMLGISRDPAILTNGMIPTNQTSHILHKTGTEYMIMKISHATSSFNK